MAISINNGDVTTTGSWREDDSVEVRYPPSHESVRGPSPSPTWVCWLLLVVVRGRYRGLSVM
jgi:hypothetical protein